MNIISYLFEPVVFFGVLASLFVLSMLVIFSFTRQSQRLNREVRKNLEEDKIRISELEAMLQQRQGELKKHITAQESQLEAQLKEKEDLLKKEIYVKDGLSRKIKELEEEVAKLKRELALSNQMYDGLKGQYDELERNSERLAQQVEEGQPQSKKEAGLEQLLKLEELTRPQQSLTQEENSQSSSEDSNLRDNLESP